MLIRLGGAVVVPFGGGRLVERFTRDAERLIVDRFDPASLYPRNLNNKGEGAREK